MMRHEIRHRQSFSETMPVSTCVCTSAQLFLVVICSSNVIQVAAKVLEYLQYLLHQFANLLSDSLLKDITIIQQKFCKWIFFSIFKSAHANRRSHKCHANVAAAKSSFTKSTPGKAWWGEGGREGGRNKNILFHAIIIGPFGGIAYHASASLSLSLSLSSNRREEVDGIYP